MTRSIQFRNKVIAVIGCPPLPGSPMHQATLRSAYIDYVLEELSTLISGSVGGVMLQNIGDLPVPSRARVETVAWMSTLGTLFVRKRQCQSE